MIQFSEASLGKELLSRLDGPILITAYARANPSLRTSIQVLVDRYRRYKSDIELSFVNPDAVPDEVRDLGIIRDGELYLQYQGRDERLQRLTEQAMTNALQRLSRRKHHKVRFLTGHGERAPHGRANHDLGNFIRELERTGIQVHELNLAETPKIPADTRVLVIAAPQVPLMPGEVDRIREYLDAGGQMLWLAEPNESAGLESIAETLGLRVLPGVIVDPDGSLHGIDNPAFILVADYGPHAITHELKILTLFPMAAGLEVAVIADWTPQELLSTQPRTWTETSPLKGSIRFDPTTTERNGPLTLGLALTRPHPTKASLSEDPATAPQQRVVVLGDGDFLSNAYLGNGGNVDFGLNIVNWLSQDDALITIRAKSAPDLNLQLSEPAMVMISAGFLLILPGMLLAGGWTIWFRRRRR